MLSLCPACVFPLVQECPCFLGVLDLCHLCSFDISVLCLFSVCHLCFNDATLSCLCLLSSARVSLLPGCPHSVSYINANLFMPSQSVSSVFLCAAFVFPLVQECPCLLVYTFYVCHLCPFDVLMFASFYAFSACATIPMSTVLVVFVFF